VSTSKLAREFSINARLGTALRDSKCSVFDRHERLFLLERLGRTSFLASELLNIWIITSVQITEDLHIIVTEAVALSNWVAEENLARVVDGHVSMNTNLTIRHERLIIVRGLGSEVRRWFDQRSKVNMSIVLVLVKKESDSLLYL